ncbi:MAG: tripartite tricarboxylate transporter substrate binding protein, partial [Comamonadaceae bacterium]
MPSTRRTLLVGVAATIAALFGLAPQPTRAQATADYPNKPIRIVVPFPPGGATDVLARVLGQQMSANLGQPVVIDNKPGAAGIIGTDAVAKAPPDGYTLVLSLSNSLMTNEFLYEKLPYNTQRDLTLVYQIAKAPLVLVAHPGVPARTGPELLKYVAANKGKVAYGSYGVGAYPHLAGAHMSMTQQAEMNHVAYKGEAPMLQDLIGGQIQIAYASALAAKPHIESGKLNALGVSGDRRMGALPDVPTLAEQGLKDEAYRVTGWLAVAAPAKTPPAIVQKLSDEVRRAVRQ